MDGPFVKKRKKSSKRSFGPRCHKMATNIIKSAVVLKKLMPHSRVATLALEALEKPWKFVSPGKSPGKALEFFISPGKALESPGI